MLEKANLYETECKSDGFCMNCERYCLTGKDKDTIDYSDYIEIDFDFNMRNFIDSLEYEQIDENDCLILDDTDFE